MHSRHLLFAMIFMACGGGGTVARAEDFGVPDEAAIAPAAHLDDAALASGSGIEEDGPDVPYDRALQKSVHNSYEREEPLIDQLVYHRVRSLELDIHVRREGSTAPAREWFVYHEDNPLMRSTSCSQLSDCLGQVATFHGAAPRHEVVTLFVDLKEDFATGHQPPDLDDAIVKALGRANIATPADVIAACAGAGSIRESVTGACHFPTLGALRGKFVIVMTGGTSCDAASRVSLYGGSDARLRLAFLAPNVDGGCTVESYDTRPNVVFFNMPFAERVRATDVRTRGLVTRIYGGGASGGLDNAGDFTAARTAGAVHLATDKVSFEEDGWAASHLTRGFPFTCEGCGNDLVEPGAVLGLRATSGDQWATADSAVFAYESDDADATWSALVSVPSSHVDPLAKACLVARASEDPGAANVAICRAFNDSPPRAQIRQATGAATRSIDASIFDGITGESPALLRLAVASNGASSEVTASASRDGKMWSTIAKTTVNGKLPLRGVSVSSHGNATVKGLFANLVRQRNGTATVVTTAALQQKAVGAGASGDAFEGVFPP